MKEEIFDEWFTAELKERFGDKFEKDLFIDDFYINRITWDHQQKKIDEFNNELGESDGMVVSLMAKLVAMENKLAQAKKENKALESKLTKAVEFIRSVPLSRSSEYPHKRAVLLKTLEEIAEQE